LGPIKKRLTRVEAQIEKAEKALGRFNSEMQAAAQSQDGKRISELSRAIHSSQNRVDSLYEELEKWTLRSEAAAGAFDQQLDRIDASGHSQG
jgi:ATP-binding cassette subfamily F protein 3